MLGRRKGKNQSTDVYEITCKSINNTLHVISYKSYNLLTGENDLRTEFNLGTLVITTFHDDRFFGRAIGFSFSISV